MREVWKDEGKEEGWRDVGDIMNEEDVMETSIMHICIPDYERKKTDGLKLPSGCSYYALSVLLNERSDTDSSYHFPVYDIIDQLSNVVLIRNLPSNFNLHSAAGTELKSMIENVCPVVSIIQSHSGWSGVVRVTVHTSEDAVKVTTRLDGELFHDVHLRVSHDDRRVHHTLVQRSISFEYSS